MIRIEDLALSILTKTTVIPEFKSKDGDLNEFLMQEAIDAYADAVSFYENKGGFKFFTETDINDDTRLLYFDLKPFKDALETVEKQS